MFCYQPLLQAVDISPNPGRSDPMYVVYSRKKRTAWFVGWSLHSDVSFQFCVRAQKFYLNCFFVVVCSKYFSTFPKIIWYVNQIPQWQYERVTGITTMCFEHTVELLDFKFWRNDELTKIGVYRTYTSIPNLLLNNFLYTFVISVNQIVKQLQAFKWRCHSDA